MNEQLEIPTILEGPTPKFHSSPEPVAMTYQVEVFECPQCGKPWQRALGKETFLQPRVCWNEPANDFEVESGWKNHGCRGLLPCDLQPGERVSLEIWDETERPSNRLGECSVVKVEPVRNCQTGYLVTVENDEGIQVRLDRLWLVRLRPVKS